MRDRMERLVRARQEELCERFAEIDGSAFEIDSWEREGGGGGETRVIQDGGVFEKAGINVSVVEGELSSEAAREMGGGTHIEDRSFFAAGLSMVLHPHNPMAPTFHANYRYFERGEGTEPGSWWFGGGADLTPAYLFEEDVRHFHATLKQACDEHDPEYYSRFKEWCDEYFYLDHREEHRGVGGIFFDDLNTGSREELFDFVADCAGAIGPAYAPVVRRRAEMDYDCRHERWQRMRRGRYVEFNLVYDRGTKFGLRSGGRTESILVSMPLEARWEYDHRPDPNTEEARMMEVLEDPREWV